MDRRDFLQSSSAAILSALFAGTGRALASVESPDPACRPLYAPFPKDGPVPAPEITAAVDVLVPPDPEIPGDFKGSDYGADWVVAASLGDLGQALAVALLDSYARQVADASFLACDEVERLEAIKQWIRERDELSPMMVPILSGVLTLSIIGTYEDITEEERLELFESMGWYDPADPAGTFFIPNEGYPDSAQLPVRLRMGTDDD